MKCDSRLGFAPDSRDLVTLDPMEDGQWRAIAGAPERALYRRCANDWQQAICNWLIPAADRSELCVSCRCNETIPDLTAPGNLAAWAKIEAAKRRSLYTLIQLQHFPKEAEGLRFRFLGGATILTGHENGIITLNMAEADDAERERRRLSLHEPYRTLMGHFRHEIGHYYWDRLIANTPDARARFQKLFGDESKDYGQALQQYYAAGPQPNWPLKYVTAYATAHPWEDWAETWAHYLHMRDTIETAASFGISLRPKHPDARAMTTDPAKTLREPATFDPILQAWIPLTYALNTLNRGMGLPDLYPFILTDAIIEKLRFVHGVLEPALAEEA